MTEQITVRGYVATDPESRSLPDGTVVVTFRLASTPRWFDQQSSAWRDGHTNWFSVQAFRALGLNALASIKKGQPVVVVGKLKVRSWEGEHGRSTAVDVDAVSIGHDLALGTACFQRTVTASTAAEPNEAPDPAGDGAAPSAPEETTSSSGQRRDPAEDDPPAPEGVDPGTGEIRPGADPGRRPRRQPATA